MGGGFYIGTPQDIFNLQADRSVSGFHLRQRFVTTVLYDVPFFRNLHSKARYLHDGWQVSTIVTAQTGFPTAITSNLDTTGTGTISRPNRLADGNLPDDQRTYKKWFDTDAFRQATFGSFGTSPRTESIRLPGLVNFDFSATKSFRFREKTSLQIRAEFFNLFNHYNPDPQTVDTNRNSATFGAIGGGVQGITTRVIQLGGKFYF